MPLGPGKYDALATYVREQAQADGVILVVLGGNQGEGFSVQGTPALTLQLPTLLRLVADGIETSLRA